jgi:putative transposase
MNDIITTLTILHPLVDTTTYRQFNIIAQALLVMTGRITMLSMSRWTEKGGSYRTIQRFFGKTIPWDSLNWMLFKASMAKSDGAIIIAGDATTVTKSGKNTFGLGRFFSSIYSRAVPGIAFQTLSLLNVDKRKSWPMLVEQILPKPKQETPTATKAEKKRKVEAVLKAQKTKTAVIFNSMQK